MLIFIYDSVKPRYVESGLPVYFNDSEHSYIADMEIMAEINGIIIARDWDIKGNAIAISIMAPDEREYLVEDNEKGRELVRFLRQKATVFGNITRAAHHKPVIKVAEYAIWTWEERGQ